MIIGEEGQFPSSWIDTRNYYTHWDSALLPNTLNPQAMYEANFRMAVYVRVLYIHLMGIPDDVVLQALGGTCHIAQFLIQLNAREHRKKFAGSTAGALMYILKAMDRSKMKRLQILGNLLCSLIPATLKQDVALDIAAFCDRKVSMYLQWNVQLS